MIVFLVVAGAANAVNLTDGLDGLAAGIAATVLLSYTAIAFVSDQRDLAIFGATLAGACVGFLWFNSFPAAVFMGDTGSYAIGGRDRGDGGDDEDRDPAGGDRGDLRGRGAVGHHPGDRVQEASGGGCS